MAFKIISSIDLENEYKIVRRTGIGIVASQNRVAVCETDYNCVKIFNTDGTRVYNIGSFGHRDSQFSRPCGVAFDSFDRLYVVDDSRVQIFNENGKFVNKFLTVKPASSEIAIDQDNIYVTRNNCIDVYSFDGNPIKTIEMTGFIEISDVAINSQQHIICTDYYSMVRVFVKDASYTYNFATITPNKYSSCPTSITVDKFDNILITNINDHHIQLFTPDGVFNAQTPKIHLNRPLAITVNENNKIFVGDNTDEVKVFEILYPDTRC